MARRILVPLDGSPLAERILAQVTHESLRVGTEWMLLHILKRHPAAERAEGASDPAGEARRAVEELQLRLRARGIPAQAAFMTGEPAAEILAFAEAYRPSLVAMSTHGRSGLSRAVRGSVAEQVLRKCPFPTLLAGPLGLRTSSEPEPQPIRTILVPTDGSEASTGVAPLVEDWAACHGAEIVLLHVVPAAETVGGNGGESAELRAGEAKCILDRFVSRFSGNAARIRARWVRGIPEAEIVQAAREERADLVAMATHGRTGLSRFLLGSVTEAVLRTAPCPILVARSAAATIRKPTAAHSMGKER